MHNANFYHAHIYFEDKTRASAEKVREDIEERFGGQHDRGRRVTIWMTLKTISDPMLLKWL